MTHYSKSYGIENVPQEVRDRQALQDIEEYMGSTRYKVVISTIKQGSSKVNWSAFQFLLDIAGVRGYPVEALYRHIYGEDPEWEYEDGQD